MNKVILIGRLIKDPDIRTVGANNTTLARYTLAVTRKYKTEGQADSDFIPCVAMGKLAEFTEKYFRKGSKVVVEGRIQTGSYTNKDGNKVYTTDVMVESQEFAESKNASNNTQAAPDTTNGDGFMNLPSGVEDEGLPFA